MGGYQPTVPGHVLVVEHVRPASAGGHVSEGDQQVETGLCFCAGFEGDERVEGEEGAGTVFGVDRETAGREEETAGTCRQNNAPPATGEGHMVFVARREVGKE